MKSGMPRKQARCQEIAECLDEKKRVAKNTSPVHQCFSSGEKISHSYLIHFTGQGQGHQTFETKREEDNDLKRCVPFPLKQYRKKM